MHEVYIDTLAQTSNLNVFPLASGEIDTDGAAGRYWHVHWCTYGLLIAIYGGDKLSVKFQQPNTLMPMVLTAWL